MQKIISLFQRNYDGDRLVRDEVTPGAEWVLAGEGVATRKFDGACCLYQEGRLYKRYDHKPDNWQAIQRAKKNSKPAPEPIYSPAPAGFEAAQERDPITMHQPGWLPVGDGPEDAYFREAFADSGLTDESCDGTYELCGPKVQGNPEGFHRHILIRHGVEKLPDAPRAFEDIKQYLANNHIEGIVWYHPDGRMVKIKAKDFGLIRKAPRQ